jgi:hypothetical protein
MTATTGTAAYRQSLERRDGNARVDASRSRGNGGTRRHGSDDDKVPQEMTVRARQGVVVDLASRRISVRARPLKCRVVQLVSNRIRLPGLTSATGLTSAK